MLAVVICWPFNSRAADDRRHAAAESPALPALLAQPVGADAAAALALPRRLAWLGQERQAGDLWRALLQRYLQHAQGDVPDRAQPVAQALAAGAELPRIESDRGAQQRWAAALQRQLQPQWPGAEQAVPVPEELENFASHLRPLAPGVWATVYGDDRVRGLVWVLRLRHAAPALLLSPGDFGLRIEAPGSGPLSFDCAWPRFMASKVMAPGQAVDFICRLAGPVAAAPRAWQLLARQLAGHAPGPLPLQWLPHDLDDEPSAQRMTDRLAAAAGGDAAFQAFKAQNPACARQGSCQAGVVAAASQRPEPREKASTAWQRLKLLALFLAAFGLYAVLARLFGTRSAAVATGLLTEAAVLALAWQVVPGAVGGPVPDAPSFGALIIPMVFIGLALGAPFVVAGVLGFFHGLVFGDWRETLAGLWRWLRRAETD